MVKTMNKLEQLIKELCPNGVEWKTLGEVAELKRGRVMSKEYLVENSGTYPVYSSQTANNGEIGKIATFDFDQEIYGQHLQVNFLHKLRDEEKYADLEKLIAQIKQDIKNAKHYFMLH